MIKEVTKQQEEHDLNVLDMQDSKSNREKVFSAGGAVFFGKIYGCRDISTLSGAQNGKRATVQVFLTKYTAVSNIRKSPEAKNNRNKICSKGKTLYVLGDVPEREGECSGREYLVFSEASCVYKRQWAQLKSLVIPAGSVVQTMDVIGVGFVKERAQKPRRHIDMIQAYKVQFTNDVTSTVWVTVPGLQHMAALSQTQLSLPQIPLSLPPPQPPKQQPKQQQQQQQHQEASPQSSKSPMLELPPPLPPSLAERESLKQMSLGALPLCESVTSTVTFGKPSVKTPIGLPKSNSEPSAKTKAIKGAKRTTVVPIPMLDNSSKNNDSSNNKNGSIDAGNSKNSGITSEDIKKYLPSFPDVLSVSMTGYSGPVYKPRAPLIASPLSTLFTLKDAGVPSVKPPSIAQKL